MKIMKIFGIVVGIHVFVLIVIFANPGCSSTTKPPPAPADTVTTEPAPMITVPGTHSGYTPTGEVGMAANTVPPSFNPDAPASYASGSSSVRFTPTRPNTPAASAVATQPVENVTPATTYVVRPGDSLWTLQKKFHINYKEIAAANNLKTGTPLREGQKLIIPAKPVTAPTSTAASATGGGRSMVAPTPSPKTESAAPAVSRGSDDVKHVVKSGETLGGIARQYDVSVKELGAYNNIADPKKLRPGTELSIPGWKSTATKAGRAPATAVPSQPAPPPAAPPVEPQQPVNILAPEQSQPAPADNVPVIRIDPE